MNRILENSDDSASGIVSGLFEGIEAVFTDFEVIAASEVNVVVRARRYGRLWVLKALNPAVADREVYRRLLRKEFEILARLQHPAVVGVGGFEEVDGFGPCIVMEHVQGVTLGEWLKGAHSRSERRRVAQRLLEGVAYIHSQSIVHRDLKPENIIITDNGANVKIIDFGVADSDSHTVLKQPAGTPRYMSEEQRALAVPDVKNDIYSLGVIFEELKPGYGRIAKRCVANADRRYASVDRLQSAIRARGRRHMVMLTAAVLAATVGVGVLFFLSTRRTIDSLQVQNELQKASNAGLVETVASQKTRVSESEKTIDSLRTTIDSLRTNIEERDAVQRRFDKALAEGMEYLNRIGAASRQKQMIDTLTNINYYTFLSNFNPATDKTLSSELTEGMERYIRSLGPEFNETERAEIRNRLMAHTLNYVTRVFEKLEKLSQ